MSEHSSDSQEHYNPYYVPRSADGNPDGHQRTQKQIEEESGGVVKTEHGERYRCLVIDRSGSPSIPDSI